MVELEPTDAVFWRDTSVDVARSFEYLNRRDSS